LYPFARDGAKLGFLRGIVEVHHGSSFFHHHSWAREARTRNPEVTYSCRGSGFASVARAPERRARSSRRILLAHAIDQLVLPIRQAAQSQRQRIGAAVVQMTVELPGETH